MEIAMHGGRPGQVPADLPLTPLCNAGFCAVRRQRAGQTWCESTRV
jgi:hypothetical protein